MYSVVPQKHDDTSDCHFDSSAPSRTLCRAGIVTCWTAGFLCLGFGIKLILVRNGAYLELNYILKEILPLGLNILVTFINETLGYVHTNSLRWALQREGRLTFNSNLRLFTSARTSRANAWYSNLCMLVFIIMSYASNSVVFVGEAPITTNSSGATFHPLLPGTSNTFISGYALTTLAIGILGQCIVTTTALISSVSIPSWSSDPIDTAAACATVGSLSPTPGRCLRSVHDRDQDTVPVKPRTWQKPAYRAHKEVRIVFYILWGTVGLCILWGSVLIGIIRNLKLINGIYNGYAWDFFPTIPSTVNLNIAQRADENSDMTGTMTLAIPWKVIGQLPGENHTNDPYIDFRSFCWAFALICLLQAVMTVSLHCAELVVNTIRDEKIWRQAGRRSGRFHGEEGLPRVPTNSLYALLVSGPGMTLFLLKPVLHWIFGLAVSTYFSVGLVMRPPQIIYLSLGAVLLAGFVSACALWQPKGPQPATFGHLQTLVDLIDEWPKMGERMFWGRKDGGEGVEIMVTNALKVESRGDWDLDNGVVAHAGTSSVRLEEVRFDEVYMATL